MTKSTKKQIDALAKKFFHVCWGNMGLSPAEMKDTWHIVGSKTGVYYPLATYVLGNFVAKSKKPKSCRLVRGKVVCS
jgi:hypothetical protein